ncbi:MAG: hypothetical protein IVW57_14575, partial [Ktedonobacterales bacterium]|nr:hypothetical protein [Ktedonobacterales bacterium]
MRPSHLGDILARRAPLPVRTVTAHEALSAGVVYVVPSNHNVRIADSSIEIEIDGDGRPKPSVDLLFSSAAQVYGEHLIAVILSGTGSDGAAGAHSVKRGGGTVIIQDPDTASYPGMPLALAPTTVDIVARVERIGPILHDLLSGGAVPARPDEKKALVAFLDEVRERRGLDFNSYKTPTIQRRLRRRILATESSDLEAYSTYLRTHPAEYQRLINSFQIKVTEFFRDTAFFDYLRAVVLPDVLAYSRQHENELRIWLAGCATGEEAYSLSILVTEALGTSLEHFNVRIFATDADAEAIAFARHGLYPGSALTHLSADLVQRYFTQDEDRYQVRKQVRALTVFGQHDLRQRAPFPRTDLVLCRNMLHYFTPELQQRTLKLFAYSLRDGGYLALGKAESLGEMSAYFTPQGKRHKVFRRQGDRILIPPARTREPLPLPPPMARAQGILASAELTPAQRETRRVRANLENLLVKLPVGIVQVGQHYDIQAINSAARRFLSIYGPAIGADLIHLARGVPSEALRAAIDSVFRQGSPVNSASLEEFPMEDLISGERRYFQVTCHPQHPEGEQGATEAVIVILHDITALAREGQAVEQRPRTPPSEVEGIKDEAYGEVERRERFIQELVESNRQLLEANEELILTNEELRSANEESLLNNEETQAAIEEVETLNEEFQATNEELETLNEELQATVEELNTANDDLHARGIELRDLADTSEKERVRLAAILGSIADAVLVVDRDGVPVLTNAAYERMVSGAGRHPTALNEEGQPLPPEETPERRAARSEAFCMEVTAQKALGAVVVSRGRVQ